MHFGLHKVFTVEEDGITKTLFEVTVFNTINSAGVDEGDVFEDLIFKKYDFLREFTLYGHEEDFDTNTRLVEHFIIFDITGYEELMTIKPHLFI